MQFFLLCIFVLQHFFFGDYIFSFFVMLFTDFFKVSSCLSYCYILAVSATLVYAIFSFSYILVLE